MAPEQVPGELGGRGPSCGRSLHRGPGAPLGWQLSLGSQYLSLGRWGERGQASWLSVPAQGGGRGRSPPVAPKLSPMRPASCSWIFSISMGVVTITWQVPAPQPASISLYRVSFCL